MRPRIPFALRAPFIASTLVALLAGAALPARAAAPALAARLGDDAGLVPADSENRIPLILEGRAQEALAAKVRELGGRVDYRFQHAPLLAVRVPAAKLPELLQDSRLEDAERQRRVRRAVADVNLPGIGRLPGGMMPLQELGGAAIRTLSPAELTLAAARGAGDTSSTYMSYDAWTGASQVWERANFGAGTIVVVIDTGIYPEHPLIAGSVIGGFNLVPAEEEQALDMDGDGQPDGRSFDWNVIENDSHGTSVSGLIAGHADLVLKRENRMIQSLMLYGPETLVPVPDDSAQVGVRLLGTAPRASLYGIKVFPYDGGSAPDARVAEALDRVIAMKESGELATDVVNMSLGGPSLWDGQSVIEQLTDLATERGITVVVAAGNEGPSFMTGSTPANAFTALAVGAASDPLHTRVAIEQFIAQAPVGVGNIAYPYDDIQMASFSGRGLTGDERVKPDIAATGLLNFTGFLIDRNQDGVNDDIGFGIGAGTSFACPITAGGAALLVAYGRTIGDHGRAPYVANALLGAARPIADFARVPESDQGKGYLVLPRAFDLLDTGAWNTPPRDEENRMLAFVNLGSPPFATRSCPPLGPGEAFSFILRVPPSGTQVTVRFPEVTLGDKQNPFLGDNLEVRLHSAKRGGNGDYVFQSNGIEPGDSFVFPYPEPGELRLTFAGAFTNVSPAAATFSAELVAAPIPADRTFGGSVGHDGVWERTFEVPANLQNLGLSVTWDHDWTEFPTYDLDFQLAGPNDSLVVSAGSLRSPEVALIEQPLAGTWRLKVMDLGTVVDREWFRVGIYYDVGAGDARSAGRAGETGVESKAGARVTSEPAAFLALGATPNPARPETAIRFALGAGGGGHVTVAIYDVAGRLVRRLESGLLAPGEHALAWDGRNDAGQPAAAGFYVYRITAPGGTATHKLLLAR